MYFFMIIIISIIHFYFLNGISSSILFLILSIITYIIIMILIYKYLKEKMEEKEDDNVLYTLAHEVKNPLAVCKGYLDMLDTNDNKKIEKYLPIIKKEMNRSVKIMDEFLDLKRIKINKDMMDFSLLLSDIKETVQVLKENNVSVKVPKIDKEIIIDGDYDKLKQVLMNIIKNSYEAEAKNIKLEIKTNSNYLKLKIIDDGKGISKNDLKNIGKIFYTTKATGTGVGVSMAKEIIKLHDGNLNYDSVLNKGTTATIILPISYIF